MPEATLELKPLYKVDEFLKDFSMSRGTFYNYVNDGRIRPVKRGKFTVVTADEAKRFLDNLPSRPRGGSKSANLKGGSLPPVSPGSVQEMAERLIAEQAEHLSVRGLVEEAIRIGMVRAGGPHAKA